MKSTQPLPALDSGATSNATSSLPGTHPLSQRWPQTRRLLLAGAGGAALAFAASGAMQRAITRETPPRSLPKAAKTSPPERLTLDEWRRRNPADAAIADRAGGPLPNVSSAVVDAGVVPTLLFAAASSPGAAAVEVAEANEDGTAWKNFAARSEGDRRRLADRREEDRLLAERRVLEDEKKRVERALEVRALQEKYRAEDRQAEDARRDEDRRRIQGRVDEDRRATEERERRGEQLAEAPQP